MVLVLLTAHAERFSVSRMQYIFVCLFILLQNLYFCLHFQQAIYFVPASFLNQVEFFLASSHQSDAPGAGYIVQHSSS